MSFFCFTLTENVINCFALNPLPHLPLNVIWRSSVNKSNYQWSLKVKSSIYIFHVKTKILADFQKVYLSAPLKWSLCRFLIKFDKTLWDFWDGFAQNCSHFGKKITLIIVLEILLDTCKHVALKCVLLISKWLLRWIESGIII